MSVTLDLCLMLAVVTASPGDDIVRAVVANGHRKVGVIPMVIQTNGEKQSTIGPLGPRAKTMAKGVYDKLVSASRDGKFAKKYNVIPDKVMSRALKSRGITVDDLGDPEKLKALASSTGGMDGMVLLTFDDEDNQTDSSVTSVEQGEKPDNNLGSESSTKKIEGEIQDPSEVTTTYSDQFSDLGTLSKLAYEGRSWWLRRWDGETIVNIGLDIEGSDAFGQGSSWEHVQAEKLKPNLEHPATVVDFPYSFDVFVGGKRREPAEIKGLQVVELNPGEEYSLRVDNRSSQDVYIALYIDGVSSIDKVLAEPQDLPTSRHWFIAKGSGPKEMAGWYNIDWNRGETQFFNRFRIVDSAESVAASKDFEENIGMITAIFYTVGMDNIPVARKRTRSLGKSMFGTGEGERVDQVLEKVQRSKRGIILAAMTYYYRSREEIQDLQGGGDGDDLVFTGLKDKKEDDAVGDSNGSKSDDGDLIIIDDDK